MFFVVAVGVVVVVVFVVRSFFPSFLPLLAFFLSFFLSCLLGWLVGGWVGGLVGWWVGGLVGWWVGGLVGRLLLLSSPNVLSSLSSQCLEIADDHGLCRTVLSMAVLSRQSASDYLNWPQRRTLCG